MVDSTTGWAAGMKPLLEFQENGTAVVRPQTSALDLFGSLKPAKPFPGLKAEKEAVKRLTARQAAKEGLK